MKNEVEILPPLPGDETAPRPLPPSKASRMSPRENQVLGLLMTGQATSLRDAARQAGYAEGSLDTAIYRNKRIKNAIREIMDKQGLTDDSLVKTLGGLIKKAKRPMWNMADKKWDMFDDNDTIRSSLHMAFKLKGAYPEEERNQFEGPVFNFIIKGLE